MEAHGGCIIGISSVAGDRGRKANFVYGSAKAGFTAFLSGLRNRLHGKVHVITVKPGFVATRDRGDGAAARSPHSPARSPKQCSRPKKRRDVIYVRRVWRPIMRSSGHPERMFKRMSI